MQLTSTSRSRLASRGRAGFTLVEMMTVLVLLGIVVGSIVQVIAGQQRFAGDAAQVMETRGNVRQIADILPSELRGVSASGGDIYALGDRFLEVRAPIGSTIVCTIDVTRMIITVPPLSLSAQNGLTAWLSTPLQGDSLFVFDEGPTQTAADDAWQRVALTAAPLGAAACPTTTNLTRNATEAAAGFTLRLSAALSPTVTVGSVIRFFRRTRYELYQASDGNWYLGWYDCVSTPSRATPCSIIQPLLGPYLPYVAGGAGGLKLAYFDSTGAATNVPARVARIDVTVRARSLQRLRSHGWRQGWYQDSLDMSIAVRNRS
jgi:prepilin-type N-terminal cleavage/methylation domain-containing protein